MPCIHRCLCDLLPVDPAARVVQQIFLGWSPWFRVNRLLRVVRLNWWFKEMSLHSKRYIQVRLVKLMGLLMLAYHFAACLYFVFVRVDGWVRVGFFAFAFLVWWRSVHTHSCGTFPHTMPWRVSCHVTQLRHRARMAPQRSCLFLRVNVVKLPPCDVVCREATVGPCCVRVSSVCFFTTFAFSFC